MTIYHFRSGPVSQKGFFISFEGSEGCGKSTQIRLLTEYLQAQGRSHVVLREPGGTPIGETIRHLLKHSAEGREMTAETELLLFAASRAQLVRQTILPALAEGRVVITDRFLDSTTVYQGVARDIPAAEVEQVNRFAAGPRLPDVTYLLDMDSATAFARAKQRGATPDRMEEEPPAFYEAVRQGYLALAAREPARIRVLDATLPPADLAREIQTDLARHGLFQGIRA